MSVLISDIINFINETTLSGMLLGIYMVFLILFAFINNEDDRDYVKGIIYPGIVMFIGIFIAIPFVNRYIVHFTDLTVQPRYVWIMTPTIVLALGFTIFVRRIDGEYKKIIAIVAICFIVFCCGEYKINSYIYKKPENLYKLPQSVIDITEIVITEMESPKICVPASSAYPFRQISTKVRLFYGEDATIDRIIGVAGELRDVAIQMERSQPDLYYITNVCKRYNVDYIVLDQSYMIFGETDLNDEGYEPNHVYLGDRTPVETEGDGVDHSRELNGVNVIRDANDEYWDFRDIGLEYKGTYGQYLLYKIK